MADAIERGRLADLRAFFIEHQCRIRAQNGSACMPRVEQGGRGKGVWGQGCLVLK